METTIENHCATPVRLVEVDYPSASFGAGSLDANSSFHYRFKIQGSGNLKLEFTDAANKVHEVNGPVLNQGQEGRLSIAILPTGEVSWQPQLTSSK